MGGGDDVSGNGALSPAAHLFPFPHPAAEPPHCKKALLGERNHQRETGRESLPASSQLQGREGRDYMLGWGHSVFLMG